MSGTYPQCTNDARQRWPRLACLPVTNAIGVCVLFWWSASAAISFADALLARDLSLPGAWWEGLKWFTAYAFAQFAAKRWTHGRGTNGTGGNGASGGVGNGQGAAQGGP